MTIDHSRTECLFITLTLGSYLLLIRILSQGTEIVSACTNESGAESSLSEPLPRCENVRNAMPMTLFVWWSGLK